MTPPTTAVIELLALFSHDKYYDGGEKCMPRSRPVRAHAGDQR